MVFAGETENIPEKALFPEILQKGDEIFGRLDYNLRSQYYLQEVYLTILGPIRCQVSVHTETAILPSLFVALSNLILGIVSICRRLNWPVRLDEEQNVSFLGEHELRSCGVTAEGCYAREGILGG